jgi:carbon monoxide dehydrogenase subunit G
MDVEGSFTIPAPRDRVWALITDPKIMARCIPGCESIAVQSPTSYKATIKLALGVFKMTFNVVVDVTEEVPPERVFSTTRGEEGSKASIISAKNRLELVALDPGSTEVRYASSVMLTGRLGKFGLGMMRKKADGVAAEFGAAFAKVAAGEDAAA